jgi:hypothetical protein
MGQSNKNFALGQEKLAWEEISERWREVGYVQHLAMVETQTNPVIVANHQTHCDEECHIIHVSDWISFRGLVCQIP